MYSGEDSSGDPLNSRNQFATWALGQTACSASEDNVDWAALAQQWIQMKESCSINTYNDNIDNNIPVAPPPPQISIGTSSFKDYEEQGEAPMEVVKEDETFLQSTTNLSNTNTDGTIQFAPNPPEWQSTWFQSQSQFCPTWNTWSNPNTMPVQIPAPQVSVSSIPSINLLKDVSHITPNLKISDNMSSNEMPMDAAKRKTLPAWIREGLEKMEKEKLKQMEKNREMNKQDFIKDENEINTEKNIDEKKSLLLQDDNSEKSDYEPETENNSNVPTINLGTVKEDYVEKTKEERIEELMLIVRKSLTELLLEVTNEEILTVAQEAFRKNKAKASSVQVFRKSALSSITNKLGLGAYADSGSDNSDAETDKSEQEPEDICDSEEELKESIRARHDAFKLIAQRIEASCMESEEREYRRNMDRKELICSSSSMNGSSPKKSLIGNISSSGVGGGNNYENEYGEAHPDKKNISNGKRTKERTSRFSSAKDSKYKTNIYTFPTSGTSATASIIASSSSSMPPVASGDYDKRKSSKIPKSSSYLSDSSTSSNSSDSDRNYQYRSKSSRNRTRDRDRDRERSKDRDKERERDKDKDNTGKNSSSRHKEREKNSGKIKEKIRGGKDRSNSKDKDRERSKDGDRERGRDRNKSREKDKDRYRDRSRDYTREKDRSARDRSRDREKERDRHNKKFRSSQRRDSNRTNNSSDSDDYYHQSSSRRRHRTKDNDNRSRSNTPRSHSPHIRSSRSRSKSHY